MKYGEVVEAEFLDRPNRFIAHVKLEGRLETVHVKNTGRCRELLRPGAKVYLERSGNPDRKTPYDLIAVEKRGESGSFLVNMDSQAPNRAAAEWLLKKELFPDLKLLRPETVYGKSRFDFYIETSREKIFLEVKGVTLEEDGAVSFPDAPSERAVKHMEELVEAQGEGYQGYVLFVIQMEGPRYFMPNREHHEAFARALCAAVERGVRILAYDCLVEPDSLELHRPVPVRLHPEGRPGCLEDVPGPLLEWYDRSRRILPWREEPSPYRVWVSEIMLQQTRVEAVKPYFERFMKRLPDIRSLALAPEEELLKLWEGLGYYNRVRNLQKAARQILEEHQGVMPDEYEKLLTLQGIGSYTAGAIASIAFGRPVPAVDGNVLRVVSRIRMEERSVEDGKVRSSVEADLGKIIPRDRPGDFNQAMMEIGACVCLPNGAPRCGVCPLSEICLAHGAGRETDFPVKTEKKRRKVEEKTVLLIRDENKAALHKRSGRGLLAGMYEFPSLEGFRTAEEVTEYLEKNGIRVLRIQPLPEAKHIFTHKEWHMKAYMIRVDELSPREPTEETKEWIFAEALETQAKYPIPSAFAAYTGYLNIRLGRENELLKEMTADAVQRE